jgi:hypothetical protein
MRLKVLSDVHRLAVVALIACGSCHRTGDVAPLATETTESTMDPDIRALSNSDIEWHGTAQGFYASLRTERAKRLAGADAKAMIGRLLPALSEADKFAAAHVLLTSLSHVEYSSFPNWNGLRVDIRQDGAVVIDEEQRHELARRWQRWYQMNPRPPTLPTD